MVQYDRIILLLFAALITIPVIMKSRPSSLAPDSAAFSVITSSKGYVRVDGNVRHPGIYPIFANMLTVDAIRMAEPLQPATGFNPRVCAAIVVRNGTSIKVARNLSGGSEVFFGSMSAAQRIVLGIPLDINAMSEEDFDRIPGIGPVLARRIVEYRQINGGEMGVEDLLNVDGIGGKKYIYLKKYLTYRNITILCGL